MDTIICAGGSGFKVLESVIHLCAAGLGPRELRILTIDPDTANGNAARTRGLLQTYGRCQRLFRGRLGGAPLFQTRLNLLGGDGAEELRVWSPVGNETLSGLINHANLGALPAAVADLFFTREELDVPLRRGFLGHTAIGAAAMSMVWRQQNAQPWVSVVNGLRDDLAQPAGSNVFVVGSVFGGTGASAIHPIVRFLRDIPEVNHERLHVGVGAVVPYFRFELNAQREADVDVARMAAMAAKAEGFPVATRAAAEFYDYLRRHDDLRIDAFFWAGDGRLEQVSAAIGGSRQMNPAHFVDLLLGLACLGFFRQPLENAGCLYSGPRQEIELEPSLGDQNVLEWPDLPLHGWDTQSVRNLLLQFLIVAIAHDEYFEQLFRRGDLGLEARPYCVPWYYEKFARLRKTLTSADRKAELEVLTGYFRNYFRAWWCQIHKIETIRLFARLALGSPGAEADMAGMLRLASLLWSREPDEPDPAAIHDFVGTTVKSGRKASGTDETSTYLAILAESAREYVERVYKRRV